MLPYIHFTNPNRITNSPQLPSVTRFSMKPLFSDNAMVCYKPGSLAKGTAGTVRNAGAKSKRV
jgi:hypothetical protein